MSKDCNKVYSLVLDNPMFKKNITENNISNIDIIDIIELMTISILDVYFLKIDSDNNHLNILKCANETLINNNYPPFIINVDKTKVEYNSILFEYIKSLGYKIVNILNVDNYIIFYS